MDCVGDYLIRTDVQQNQLVIPGLPALSRAEPGIGVAMRRTCKPIPGSIVDEADDGPGMTTFLVIRKYATCRKSTLTVAWIGVPWHVAETPINPYRFAIPR